MPSLLELQNQIATCKRCPRLRTHCEQVAREKRPQYASDSYFGKPVAGFGDPDAWLWIIGLAPAAHGANRTGRVFTGDKSGEWLYRELFEFGFSNAVASVSALDGLFLKGAYVSCMVRCAPPANKPTRDEILNCRSYLETEAMQLENKKVILSLGAIASRATQEVLRSEKPLQKFKHAHTVQTNSIHQVMSYHPSQQNTFTGVLTREMFQEVFKLCLSLKNS